MTPGNRLLGTASFDCCRYCSRGMCNPDNVHTAPDDNAFALELGEHDSGAFGIVSLERLRRVENSYGASEAAEALRQLKAELPQALEQHYFDLLESHPTVEMPWLGLRRS